MHSWGCKKGTLPQVFSCEFTKISKNTFFTEHLQTTASAFSFSEAATKDVLWKKMFLKISQNWQENTFGLRNFKKHLFYRTPLDHHLWLFCAMLLKLGTANNVWKNSDEYSLPRPWHDCANQEKGGLSGKWKVRPKVKLRGLILPVPNSK